MAVSNDMIILVLLTITMFLLIWLLIRILSRVEKRKLRRLRQIDDFEAVATKSPHRNKRSMAQGNALMSISGRFRVMRRILIVAGVLIYLFIVVVLFFDRIPVAFASVIASAAAIIIGIAARPYIENIISGIVISFSDHFHTGDTVVIDGNYGTIEDISISHTIIKIWDWRRYVIPNSRMLQKDYVNYTHPDQHYWAQIKFFLSYDSDLDEIRQIAIDTVKENSYFAGHEEPRFWIMEMGENSVECWVVAWAGSPADAWNLKVEVRSELIRLFCRKGIKTHFQNLKFENTTKDEPSHDNNQDTQA